MRDELQLLYRDISDRGDVATEDELNNLMYLQRQIYFARAQLGAHLYEQAVRKSNQNKSIIMRFHN